MEHRDRRGEFLGILDREAPDLGLRLDAPLRERLALWYEELTRWSPRINLSRRLTPREAAVELVLDSLVALPLLDETGELLDIGSGAGLPGLILAAVWPERPVLLAEPSGKRAVFLAETARRMGLTRVRVTRERWPDLRVSAQTGWVTSRAVFSDAAAWQEAHLLLPPAAGLVLWRGRLPGDAPPGYAATVHPVRLPGLDQTRHLLLCRREAKPEG